MTPLTTDQPIINTPIPTTGPQGDASYYLVAINGEHYRLHNEWPLGVDSRDAHEHWEGTDIGQLDLPPDTLIALRGIWQSLFCPASSATETAA